MTRYKSDKLMIKEVLETVKVDGNHNCGGILYNQNTDLCPRLDIGLSEQGVWTSMLLVQLISLVFASENIVGGDQVSPPFKYPWLVSIQKNGSHFCGGVYLNESTIMTAGHCSRQPSLDILTVNVHRHNLSMTAAQENAGVFSVVEIIRHPQYNQFSFRNDVAIWRIKAKSPSQPLNNTIIFDDGSYSKVDTSLTVAGWGYERAGGKIAQTLRQVQVPVVDQVKCGDSYKDLEPSSICAGFERGGKDACQGDSGGPLFLPLDSSIALVGLVSYGKGCAQADYYGVYTRLSYPTVKDFIKPYIQ